MSRDPVFFLVVIFGDSFQEHRESVRILSYWMPPAASGDVDGSRMFNQTSSVVYVTSWESKGTPPMPPPPGNKALLRDY